MTKTYTISDNMTIIENGVDKTYTPPTNEYYKELAAKEMSAVSSIQLMIPQVPVLGEYVEINGVKIFKRFHEAEFNKAYEILINVYNQY